MTYERERLLEKMATAIANAIQPLNSSWEDAARAALEVIEQSGGYAPAGRWIAPEEPTEAMTRYAIEQLENEHGICDGTASEVTTIYRAMRKAAKEQKPTATQQEGDG